MKHSKTTKKSPLIALASALILSVLASTAAAAKDDPTYVMYGEARTGSRIAPKVVTSPVPVNVTYQELSEAEKAKIRANYDSMPAADEPPFPKAGLAPIWEAVTDQRHTSNQVGDVVVVASVDKDGIVREVAVYNTTSNNMTRLISTALAATEFKPAVCDGTPCAMDFILEARLDIELLRN
jgi:hypothetical protein